MRSTCIAGLMAIFGLTGGLVANAFFTDPFGTYIELTEGLDKL